MFDDYRQAFRVHNKRQNHSSVSPTMGVANNSNRAVVVLFLFLLLAVLCGLRLVYLQVIASPELSAQAQEARTVQFPIEARRGTIYDRNGTVLATSVESTTIYANPIEVVDPNATASSLASVLGGEAQDYLPLLTADATEYSIIERMADIEIGEKIKNLYLEGIYFATEWKREYPNGSVGGQVIGLCSLEVDEESGTEYYTGISGLELYYDDILSGEVGYYEAERGSDGTPIPGGVHESTPAIDGQDIIVSIDLELQQYVEERLMQDAEGLTAQGGSSIVMDASTGEIYAAASLPLADPTNRSEMEPDAPSLKVVTDLYEPGSVFKTVAMMALLEEGVVTPDTEFYCPSYLVADEYIVTDAEERGDMVMTLREILNVSSNVGTALAVEEMGFDTFYEYINKYNLHTKTDVDYPGEGEYGTDYLGYLSSWENWSTIDSYSISFGQGLSVTPLQITGFYAAIANEGIECTPHFLIALPQTGEIPEYETEVIIEDTEAVATMVDMLETVVTEGTASSAAIEGYNVAGKTSTAEIYDEVNGGYIAGVYNSGFIGFLPDASRQLVCFVGANEVPYGSITTPLFKDIMSAAIDRFNVHP